MRTLSGSLGLFLAVFLFGCSSGTVPNVVSSLSGTGGTGGAGGAVQDARGAVHGGQQAITNAAVQLWEVGTTGYGSAPTLLYSTTSDGSGNF